MVTPEYQLVRWVDVYV